jgi:hypothetical protein
MSAVRIEYIVLKGGISLYKRGWKLSKIAVGLFLTE